jgi:hypothetical protein
MRPKARPRRGNFRYPFGEDLARAGGVAAAETPGLEKQLNTPALPRQIAQAALVTAVERDSVISARGAYRQVAGPNAYSNSPVGLLYSVEDQMVRSGQSLADGVDILAHDFTIPTLSSLGPARPAPRLRKNRFEYTGLAAVFDLSALPRCCRSKSQIQAHRDISRAPVIRGETGHREAL